jgi:apolipoprotein D and lipocalin family protein
MIRNILLFCSIVILGGCMHIPKNVKPVDNFDANKYLGTWYEIARTDNSIMSPDKNTN